MEHSTHLLHSHLQQVSNLKMMAITVRALILAFAFGICIAGDFQMKDTKCKYGEETRKPIFEEMKKNFSECLEATKPGTDMKAYHENHKLLSKEENTEVMFCMSMKKGIISPDRVYSMDAAIMSIAEMDDTDQDTMDILEKGMTDCGEGKDPAAECEEIMHCVHRVIAKICFNHDIPEDM